MTARAITAGLFELDDDGTITLVGGYSPSSRKYHFPLLDSCPYTGARDVETVELSSDATREQLVNSLSLTARPKVTA